MNFEHPAWLFALLLLPLFITGAILTTRLRKKQWAAFVSPRLRGRLLRRGSSVPRWLAFGFLMAAYVFLILTLARPQTIRNAVSETVKGRNVLIALDLSKSMLARDLKPDRLTQAKTLCNELIEAMPNDRIGVVGFAGQPYLFAPLTVDHGSVVETIGDLSTLSIPAPGSNVYEGLKLSIKTLKETGQKENALILLTDGEETEQKMLALADEAKKSGMYVFAIAFGTDQGDYIPDPSVSEGRHLDKNGRPVLTKLSTESLKTLASQTGGRFAVATSAADIPQMVISAVKDLEQFEVTGKQRTIPTEYYQWFLLPAIVFLIASIIAGTRWRALAPAVASAFVFLLPAPARAASSDEAAKLMSDGKNKEAAQAFDELAAGKPDSETTFRFRVGEGTAAYRAGDMEKARSAFSQALRSKDPKIKAAAHHGMGNVLFESGWRALSQDVPYPGTSKPAEAAGGAFQGIYDALLGRGGSDPQKEQQESEDPLAPFNQMVGDRIQEWLQEGAPEGGDSEGYSRFNGVITDWIDAVKHYNSAVSFDPALEDSRSNRELTVKYLKRLREILDQVQENAQMMGSGSGQGQQQGEGEEGDQEGDGQGQGNRRNRGSNGDRQERDGNGGQNENKDQDGEGDKNKGQKPKQGETPEDAARRILRENADFEKGAPTKGRFDPFPPDKDW